MRNPLRSEAEAFRFLIATLVYFALIVIGALINTWIGLGVFVVLTAIVGWAAFLRPRDEPNPPAKLVPTATHDAGERRILVIANETVGGDELCNLIATKAGDGRANVLIVAPALNSPI